jgi:hypothetical protein
VKEQDGPHPERTGHLGSAVFTPEEALDPIKESAEELSPRDSYAAWAACYEDV